MVIERATGLERPVATVLARRGIEDAGQARSFLEADESHPPELFKGMPAAVSTVLEKIESGRKITVYGDFDCDGVCATAILVNVLRQIGADVDWFIPDRIADGYGLNPDSIKRIAKRGTGLVITVDCGVTAVDEVLLARELGMEMVITDHHQPDSVLPDCPILHPVVSEYPFPSLCGAAVAAKFASALRAASGKGVGLSSGGKETGHPDPEDESDLDLVALATVTDVMPLIGENRHLVREGIKVARRARRIGLAALMADSKVEPSRLGSEDFGFRIGPRINAAGRMYRADAGVELFLANSRDRAAEIASELSGVNAERRRVEQEVEAKAKAELKTGGEPGPAVVVAGEGWHPGVVGIVASKLVKATGRPSVVISIDGETGKGSARSVPGLDLHAALADTGELLESFGGHAAAAGLSIRAGRIDEFREALGQAVEARIGREPMERPVEFDAIAGGKYLGLDLAEQIERLAPFGNGNPAVSVLIPNASIEDLQEMGEGRHCRFSICSGPHRARGVAFGRTGFGVSDGQRVDLVAEIGLNHWNGSIEPQLRVTAVRAVEEPVPLPAAGDQEWWERFEMALVRELPRPPELAEITLEIAAWPQGPPGVAVDELISSGERLLVLCADAGLRWVTVGGETLGRFLPGPDAGAVAGIWSGSPRDLVARASQASVLITDYASLEQFTEISADRFERVALLDPPYLATSFQWLQQAGLPVHLLSGEEESAFSAQVATRRLDLTTQLRGLYRELRAGTTAEGEMLDGGCLRDLLSGDGNRVRSPEEAASLLRVLVETGLARTEGEASARSAGVVSSDKTDLSVSTVFVHHLELHKEQERFLNHFNRQTQKQ